METNGNDPANPFPTSAEATISAPELNKAGTQLKLEAKSVRNVAQAYQICKGLEWNNRQRSLRTADCQALHDGRPPRSAARQLESANAWQANASTLWMAGIVGRVSQRFVNAIISQTYVTASTLPESYKDAKTKSDLLRSKFTNLVRGWDGNTGFINAVSVETTLQGYCYAVFLDPYTWQPSFFKQEECLVPEKSGQHARDLQFFCARRDFRIDKFIELFVDEEAAKTHGYDLDNCLEAANKAVMQDPREDATTTIFRKFVDMIDEGTIGISVTGSGERVVKTWMLFNREYDGQVSFWLIGRDTGKQLRFSFKLFKRMQDVLTIFSFEAGNGCIHSSKGLGRKLAALSIMKELFRCGIIDNARMGGMFVIGVDGAQKNKIAPVMAAPFIFLDKSAVDLKDAFQLQVSAEGYQIVDTLIDSWAEQAVGAYLAAQITDKGRTERTATEASIDSRRENEAADIMIRRCLDQDATRIQMQQLRVCADDNLKKARSIYERMISEADVKPEDLYPDDIDDANLMRFLVEVMEASLTDDEIRTWSKSQASAFAHVTEGAIQRGVGIVSEKYKGDPNIDQSSLVYADLEGIVGAEMAKKLFIPKADETLAIEAGRKQQTETFVMAGSGQMIQVSPRDNHLIEGANVIQFLANAVSPILSKPNAPDGILKAAELNLNHLGDHLKAAVALGQNKLPAFAEEEKFYEGFKKQLAQVVQIRTEAAVAQQAVAARVRSESGPNGATGPNGTAPEIPGEFDAAPATEAAPSLAA